MTSEQLLPRFNELLAEIQQIRNSIDCDDPADESLQTLLDVAVDTKTDMLTATANA